MKSEFKPGDSVKWNSTVGQIQGIVQEKITSERIFKKRQVHASEAEPQYLVKSNKTGCTAIHKGAALKKIKVD